MGLIRALLTGRVEPASSSTSTSTGGRTDADRRRTAKEIRRIDRGTASWERRGGVGRRWER